jgi:four helix bundle protein
MSDNKIQCFFDLKVWQESHKFVLQIYELANSINKNEKYRITDQLLRAAVSIPTNIAEGMGRQSTKDFIKFLIIARGSVEECKYLIFLSKDLDYISIENYKILTEILNNIGKMLNGLINSLKNKIATNNNITQNTNY